MFQKEVLRKILNFESIKSLSLLSLFLSLPPLSALDAEADGHEPRPRRATSRSVPVPPEASHRHAAPSPCTHAEDCRRRATATNEPTSVVHHFSPARSRSSLALLPPLAAQTGLLPPPLLPSLLHAPSRALRGVQSHRCLPFAPPIPRLPRSSLFRSSSRPTDPSASSALLP